MSDRIFIEGLLIRGMHGVNEVERHEPQDFLLDLSVMLDTSASSTSDKIADTFDYGRLRSIAHKVFSGASCNLLEHLASQITSEVLADSRIIEISITIRKPHVYTDCVPGVSITRRQPFSL